MARQLQHELNNNVAQVDAAFQQKKKEWPTQQTGSKKYLQEPAEEAPAEEEPQDWVCSKCNNHQLAHSDYCLHYWQPRTRQYKRWETWDENQAWEKRQDSERKKNNNQSSYEEDDAQRVKKAKQLWHWQRKEKSEEEMSENAGWEEEDDQDKSNEDEDKEDDGKAIIRYQAKRCRKESHMRSFSLCALPGFLLIFF